MTVQNELLSTSNTTESTLDETNSEQKFDEAFAEFSKEPAATNIDDGIVGTENDAQKNPSEPVEVTSEQSDAPEESDTLESLREEIDLLKKEQDQSNQQQDLLSDTSQAQTEEQEQEQDFMQSEDWDSLKEDLPEVTQVIEAQKKQIDELTAQVNGVTAQNVQRYQEQQLKIMDDTVPNWRTITSGNKFENWVQNQPGQVQQLALSSDAGEVKWLINLYEQQQHKETETLEDKRHEAAKAAVEVPTRGAGSRPSGSVPDDFDQAFDYYSKQQQ